MDEWGGRPYLSPKEKRKSQEPVRAMACGPALKSADSDDPQSQPQSVSSGNTPRTAQASTGCSGPEEEILYVGKSVRVKSRLLSYFRAEPGEKAAKLIRNTLAIEWDYVPNEFAALVREMRLIKRWRPRYNVEHKRKRSFAFIKITREPAPRILPVTRILPDGATYFGPFPDRSSSPSPSESSPTFSASEIVPGRSPSSSATSWRSSREGGLPGASGPKPEAASAPVAEVASPRTMPERWRWPGVFWRGGAESP